MASNPPYDPASVQDEKTFKALNQAQDAPLLNRGTQSGYEPGSTMKVVTATAALDSGEFTPDTVLNGNSGVEISGVPLANAGGEDFGEINMTDALTNSVNTYWAQVGEQLGNDTMFEYMDRFGFNEDPPIDYPPGELNPSGVFEEGKLLDAGDTIDVGRMAIGQERLLTTPLQMAMVAAAVANSGTLVDPTFLQSVTDPDGRTTDELDGGGDSEVMSEETAATLTEMMTNVTEEGTASALSVAGADQFAGKTGTAEIDPAAGINRGWFIGFAPSDDPQIAVAAVIERTSGFGGETAGPVATDVMAALLASGQ
jgi:penicillin-binding protein A